MLKIKKLILTILLTTALFFAYAGAVNAEGSKVGIVTCDVLNVRQTPSTASKILVQIPRNTKVKVLEFSDDWYKIIHGDITGWVYAQYLTVKDEAIANGTITGDNVNVREGPDLSKNIITRFNKGHRVDVFEQSGEWYRIKLEDNKFGWVFYKYIHISEKLEDTSRAAGEGAGGSEQAEPSLREKIVNYARTFLGVKYVYGGSSPKGFDCSGFTQYVFKNFGIKLVRTAAGQAQHGEKVSKKDLVAGDLVFFDTNGGLNGICHVGIYIGGGKFIHASSGKSAKKVVISDLTQGFYANTYMGARRYIK